MDNMLGFAETGGVAGECGELIFNMSIIKTFPDLTNSEKRVTIKDRILCIGIMVLQAQVEFLLLQKATIVRC